VRYGARIGNTIADQLCLWAAVRNVIAERPRALGVLLPRPQTHHVATIYSNILVVFLTDVLERLHALHPGDFPADRPRFGVGAGVVDRGLIVQDVLVDAGVALDDVELLGMPMPRGVELGAVVEAGHVHH